MVNAWNLGMAWVNLADAATLTASGAVTLAPVSRLQNKHVMRKWRVNATSAFLICDFGGTVSVDTVMLAGLNTDNPALRVRLSTVDTSGAAGDAYDSGSLSGAYDVNYLPFVHLLAAPVSARYLRIDISQGGVAYIEAGRLFAGVRKQFTINFQAGWGRAWNDPSLRAIGRSGQTFDDLRDKYRSLELTVDFAADTDRWNVIEAIDLALGTHGDVLVLTDPSSSSLGRDCVWGYQDGSAPVIQPLVVNTGPRFRKAYKIRERL